MLELERAKAREAHGMYEELDYMHVNCPKAVSTQLQDNVSYSMKEVTKTAAHSEVFLYEDTITDIPKAI